ncbi:MAG: MarR family transcriptional regulator [Bacteroidetes bacterium]|nr:MarR family transcriptional regulator [Bacteroidota bacterium]
MKIEEEIRQSKFNSAKEKALVNIIYTANAVEDAFKKSLKSHGISLPQYNVLRILKGRKDGYATCGDLKEVMLDKNPDVTRLCDKLVLKKMIVRSNNKNNRRQILLKISEKGLKTLDEIYPQFSTVNQLLSHIPDEQLESLSDTLDLIRENLK